MIEITHIAGGCPADLLDKAHALARGMWEARVGPIGPSCSDRTRLFYVRNTTYGSFFVYEMLLPSFAGATIVIEKVPHYE